MPIISAIGAASSKGFGEFQNPQALTTVTYTSNTTFVVPLAVNVLRTVTGKGQDGINGSVGGYITASPTGFDTSTRVSITTGFTSQVPNYFPPDPYSSYAAIVSTINSTSGLTASSGTVYGEETWIFSTTTNASNFNSSPFTLSAYYMGGTASISGSWPGTLSNPQAGSYTVSYQAYNQATAGANTTGFSLTFSGGAVTSVPTTAAAATPVTYTNVAVTPGASYPLVIPSSGYITISYFTPI